MFDRGRGRITKTDTRQNLWIQFRGNAEDRNRQQIAHEFNFISAEVPPQERAQISAVPANGKRFKRESITLSARVAPPRYLTSAVLFPFLSFFFFFFFFPQLESSQRGRSFWTSWTARPVYLSQPDISLLATWQNVQRKSSITTRDSLDAPKSVNTRSSAPCWPNFRWIFVFLCIRRYLDESSNESRGIFFGKYLECFFDPIKNRRSLFVEWLEAGEKSGKIFSRRRKNLRIWERINLKN